MSEGNLHFLRSETILSGRYKIKNVLGMGGFGITYIADDILSGADCAIKEYFPQGIVLRNHEVSNEVTVTYITQEKEFLDGKQRFINEAKIMAHFRDNPGIVQVTDYFEDNNTAYIVMEYLDGITLKNYLKSNGTIPAQDILDLFVPLLEALDQVHSYGLIHRDISPDNIMVMPGNQIKLMDFGAARDYTQFGEKSLSIVLKPGYAPAEQYQSHGVQGPWTDIYALCATIYRCITGKVPEDSIQRVMDDHLKKPSELGIRIMPSMEKALMKGMSVSPKERYQNLKDFCDDLYGDESHGLKKSPDHGMIPSDKTEKEERIIPQPASPKSDKNPFPVRYAALAATVLFFTFVLGYFVYQKSLERTVPDFTGMEYQSAKRLAEGDDDSLKLLKEKEEYSDSVKKGSVISQSEEPGTKLKKGDSVKVIVSKGALIIVPDVRGKEYTEAVNTISDSKLKAEKGDAVWSDTVKNGYVVSQSVSPGEKLEEGKTVRLNVSKGIEQVEVPDLSNLTTEQAKEKLKAAKLKYGSDSKTYSSKIEEGKVVSQSHKAGKTVKKNTKISVKVSKGPKPKTTATVRFAVNNSKDDYDTNNKTVNGSKTVYVHFTVGKLKNGKSILTSRKIFFPSGGNTIRKNIYSDGSEAALYNGDNYYFYWDGGLGSGDYTVEILERSTNAIIGKYAFHVK